MCGSLLFSQKDEVIGKYYLELLNNENNIIRYRLELRPDYTFLFHAYNNRKKSNPAVLNKYGKGIWNASDKVISFMTDKEKDIDDEYQLNFTDTRARFIQKHPRNKTKSSIATKLLLLESEIPWISKIEMFKLH
ncbi:hypothetical protein ACFSQJ_05970 [Croceitalea marina]|uniref:Uncharacterized protein n=1 Tax=Croceitalea marina TaxID=1775166 RepID=A0ABW5MTU2_9FLAO